MSKLLVAHLYGGTVKVVRQDLGGLVDCVGLYLRKQLCAEITAALGSLAWHRPSWAHW